MSGHRRSLLAAAAAVALALTVPLTAGAAPPGSTAPDPATPQPYRVTGLDTAAERTAVARELEVLGGRADVLEVLATPEQAQRLRAGGAQVLPLPALPQPGGVPRAPGFPPGYEGYHDYAELTAELDALAAANPDTVAVSSYGTSVEGRALPLVKISDNVATDEDEPEVLFTCGQHAREHLTVEMCLRIAQRMAADPATLADREVWLMPNTNPDGAEHDIASGDFVSWRKNRQPNGGGPVGTDLNRNWGHQWGCCGGSSANPGSDTYRGEAAFSAPETAQIRDWVDSRVIGGQQQITAHIDWHTYSELVLWPYGYTTDDTGPGLDESAAATFRALGEAMAGTNGYTPQQASDLYITDGSVDDWMWAAHGIWSYTFEMYPTSQLGGGFYPEDSVIERETARNDAAVDLMIDYADCVPRITGGTCAA